MVDMVSNEDKEDAVLLAIDRLLSMNGKKLDDFIGMPSPRNNEQLNFGNNLINQELGYDRLTLKSACPGIIKALTTKQRVIFDAVMDTVHSRNPGFYFVHGFGGTGKTLLWNAIASSLRGDGHIVLTVASSGIAATLLPAGRTAHSRFAIPINIAEHSMCSIKQKSDLAELIIATKLIIWDEAPMIQRFCSEAFDCTLRDIMHCDTIFGGKCVVMGGDFRQILPVIPKGSRAEIVNASICSSVLWQQCRIFHLTKNMRLSAGGSFEEIQKLEWFTRWLLDVGDGKLGLIQDGAADIEIPDYLLVPDGDNPMLAMVESIYSNLLNNLSNNAYFNDRAILAPTLEMVSQLNLYMCSLIPTEEYEFLSCDSVCKSSEDIDSADDLYTPEFLNTIESSGLPPHRLIVKVGAPVMLLRNVDQSLGLCNGTRLRISRIGKNVIEAITLNGSHPNEKVLIHRMDLNPSETRLPFQMRRRQFPITLSFAMTINKSQGQSLRYVGVYLDKPVFTHGQFYVAFSRVRHVDGLKIYIPTDPGCDKRTTKNVVYTEIFRSLTI